VMDEILDEIKDETYPRYGIKSFNQMLYSILVIFGFASLVIVLEYFTSGIVSNSFFVIVSVFLFVSASISSILGVINAIRSIIKKERSHWKRKVGIVGNGLVILFFFRLFSNFVIDIYENFIQ